MTPTTAPTHARADAIHVDEVHLRVVHLPLRAPFHTAFGTWTHREVLLVRLDGHHRDGAAVTGWGECVAPRDPDYTSEYTAGCEQVLTRYLLPAFFARQAESGPVPASALDQAWAAIRGHRMAKAAFEMALLDAECRVAGISLAERLGATRTSVPVGVVIGIAASIPELVEAAEAAVAQGYRRVKCKVRPGWDAQPVAAVIDAVGREVEVMVDANGSYRPDDETHRRALHHLNDLGLAMIEQPFPVGTLDATRELLDGMQTPICLDESLDSPATTRDALAFGALDVAAIKPGRLGGILPALDVADDCRRAGVDVWHGGMLETGVGRAAALAVAATDAFTQPADLSAADRYWTRDLITDPARLQPDGTLAVPRGPGLGIEVDADLVDAHADPQTGGSLRAPR